VGFLFSLDAKVLKTNKCVALEPSKTREVCLAKKLVPSTTAVDA